MSYKHRIWDGKQMIYCYAIAHDEFGISYCEDNTGQFEYINPAFLPMQAINRYDKNDGTVFVGDILNLHNTVNGVNLFEVYYSDELLAFSLRYYTDRMDNRQYEYCVPNFFKRHHGEVEYEIIGNIYEGIL